MNKSANKLSSILALVLMLLINQNSYAQKEAYKWYVPNYIGIDFTFTNSPQFFTCNAIGNSGNGVTSICDPNGNLICYSDGGNVRATCFNTMPNGSAIAGSAGSQNTLLIKQPGNNNLYYLVAASNGGLIYSIIDINVSSTNTALGTGSVVVLNAIVPTPYYLEGKVAATKHCNGTDVWIMTREEGSNINGTFNSFLLTSTGIQTAVVTSTGVINSGTNHSEGMKFSPYGDYFAYGGTFGPYLFQFNKATGQLSNGQLLSAISLTNYAAMTVEFSSDQSRLYSTEFGTEKLYQWDLCAGSFTAIQSSSFVISSSTSLKRGMQLGPDGKIYIVRNGTDKLAVIHQPNALGAACSYTELGFSTAPYNSNKVLPNFVSNYLVPKPTSGPMTTSINALSSCRAYTFGIPTSVNSTCSNTITGLLWNFGDPLSGPNNQSNQTQVAHVFSAPGTYTVKLILNYACRNDTVTQQIVVGGPQLSINSQSVNCSLPGSATVQTTGGSGSFSYTWLPVAQSGSIAQNLSGGQYTVNVFDQLAGCVTSQTVQIASNVPTLQITAGASSVCAGTSVQLNVFGANSYTWNNGSNQTTIWVSPSQNSTYSVWGEIQSCLDTAYYTVYVHPLPVISILHDTVYCAGEKVTLNATGAQTYTWSNGAQGNPLQFNPLGTILIYVNGLDSNNCSSSTSLLLKEEGCVGINEIRLGKDWKIYPNPTDGNLHIWSEEPGSAVFCDLHGKTVRSDTLIGGNNSLNLESLSKGVYLLRVSNTQSNRTIKLVKIN